MISTKCRVVCQVSPCEDVGRLQGLHEEQGLEPVRTKATAKYGGSSGEKAIVASAIAGQADTFPKLLLRNARERGARVAFRHKDLGIWQSWNWSEVAEQVRDFRQGPAGSRAEARRKGRDHRLQPAAAVLVDVRGAVARRRAGAGLCRQRRRRDGLCARPCRGGLRLRAGPGAGRQDALHRRAAAAAAPDAL